MLFFQQKMCCYHTNLAFMTASVIDTGEESKYNSQVQVVVIKIVYCL